MSPRRIIILAALALLVFLGLYTWNQRTGQWDALGANTGLEFSGAVMRVFQAASDSVTGVWERYLALVDVREQNDALQHRVRELESEVSRAAEDRAELRRLHALLHLDYPLEWPALGARVMAGRMGSNAALETLTLSRGYLNGATPGTPVTSYAGLVGRVLKAGPSTSVALLVTDTGSRVAVISSEGRVQGILAGGGAGAPLEMRFVRQNARINVGEVLVTSGVDAAYPKGIPVARVVSVSTGSTFMQEIQAAPLADFRALEEVLLLERPAGSFAPEAPPVYTRRPPGISSDMPAPSLAETGADVSAGAEGTGETGRSGGPGEPGGL